MSYVHKHTFDQDNYIRRSGSIAAYFFTNTFSFYPIYSNEFLSFYKKINVFCRCFVIHYVPPSLPKIKKK